MRTVEGERGWWCGAEFELGRPLYIASMGCRGRSRVTKVSMVLLAVRGVGEVRAVIRVVRAIVTCVLAQDSVVKHSGSLRAFVVTVRVIVFVHGGDRARASCSWCLAGSW